MELDGEFMNSKQNLQVAFSDPVCLKDTKAYAIDLQEGISATFKLIFIGK